jgi:hypothetical protein
VTGVDEQLGVGNVKFAFGASTIQNVRSIESLHTPPGPVIITLKYPELPVPQVMTMGLPVGVAGVPPITVHA